MLEDVHTAAVRLEAFADEYARNLHVIVERQEVCDYALVCAWVDHWPSRAPTRYRHLLHRTRVIGEREPDRFIKQRRIYIARLAEHLNRAPALAE